MKVITVKHNAPIIVGDYQFADSLNKEVLSQLKVCNPIPQGDSNVKASVHTEWDWQPDNIKFRNFKSFIREKIETFFKPGSMSGSSQRDRLECHNFWGNVYYKGDYARSHCHKPSNFSFAYFVKSKWYHSPLIFSDSGRRIGPKVGRYVAFPAYMLHHVPKHRYNDSRITLSGNFRIKHS